MTTVKYKEHKTHMLELRKISLRETRKRTELLYKKAKELGLIDTDKKHTRKKKND